MWRYCVSVSLWACSFWLTYQSSVSLGTRVGLQRKLFSSLLRSLYNYIIVKLELHEITDSKSNCMLVYRFVLSSPIWILSSRMKYYSYRHTRGWGSANIRNWDGTHSPPNNSIFFQPTTGVRAYCYSPTRRASKFGCSSVTTSWERSAGHSFV